MTQLEYFSVGAVLGAGMLLLTIARAGQLPTPEDLLADVDPASLEQVILDTLPPEFDLPNTEGWQSFWNQVETILQSQSLDDMAWFRGTVQQACRYSDADPATQPWADWLRQRLDYFEMANFATQEVPAEPAGPSVKAPLPAPTLSPTKPEAKPIPTPSAKPTVSNEKQFVISKAPPAKALVSPRVESKRRSLIRNLSRWQKKLANRPAPPNAAALIPRLKQVFRSEGLPPELVWMAEAESSLNPVARSPVGALGLFQLMPATARRFGLRTGFFDERKDPEKSARAAAQYLKFLYHATGSWPLALAAYNAGEGRVGKLMERNKQRSFEGIANDLPLETQMYVPKVMALVSLRENMDPEKMTAPLSATSLNPWFLLDFPFSGLQSIAVVVGGGCEPPKALANRFTVCTFVHIYYEISLASPLFPPNVFFSNQSCVNY